MSAYRTAKLDEIAAEKWPQWAPIRHHFGIETFGINAWRGTTGDTLISEHDEAEDGGPELYFVLSGHAAFTVAGEAVDAPEGTLVWVTDAAAVRTAVASADGTLVLAVGAAAPGQAYAPSGWDTDSLEGGE